MGKPGPFRWAVVLPARFVELEVEVCLVYFTMETLASKVLHCDANLLARKEPIMADMIS